MISVMETIHCIDAFNMLLALIMTFSIRHNKSTLDFDGKYRVYSVYNASYVHGFNFRL